jgi:hypothetical protein
MKISSRTAYLPYYLASLELSPDMLTKIGNKERGQKPILM